MRWLTTPFHGHGNGIREITLFGNTESSPNAWRKATSGCSKLSAARGCSCEGRSCWRKKSGVSHAHTQTHVSDKLECTITCIVRNSEHLHRPRESASIGCSNRCFCALYIVERFVHLVCFGIEYAGSARVCVGWGVSILLQTSPSCTEFLHYITPADL